MSTPPPRRQRVGAYAVLLRDGAEGEEILLTQMSERTPIAGYWTLPGGGIDHGESPYDAVVREVYEETSLRIAVTALLEIHSLHYTGPRNDGLVEDYHGLHVVFSGEIAPGSVDVEPRVLETDSSTESAQWVPVEQARRLPLLEVASHVLTLRAEA